MNLTSAFREHVLQVVMSLLLKALSPELLKSLIDSILDVVEKAVQDSKSTIDDRVALPICALLREVFRIPDE